MTQSDFNLKIMKWFEAYIPQLLDPTTKELSFDWLGDEATSYSIDNIVVPAVLREFILGDEERQLVIWLRATQNWNRFAVNNTENLDVFKDVEKEIKKLNRQKKFPDLGQNKTVLKVEVTTVPYLDRTEATGTGTGIYVLQLRFVYVEHIPQDENRKFNIPHRW